MLDEGECCCLMGERNPSMLMLKKSGEKMKSVGAEGS